jgi:flagellar assembly factor FliW
MAGAKPRNRMKTVELDEPQKLPVKNENVISMPLGLLGFEQVKKYVLLVTPEEEPFMWLQMLDAANQGFVVVQPSVVMPSYAPDIAQADIEFLNIQSPGEALVLNIATVRNGQATVNLKGPIVINRRTLTGKQCIPTNVTEFALQHPINPVPVAA